MRKCKLLILLCFFVNVMAHAQNFNRSVTLNCQIEADTELHPFDGNPASSIGISGHITFTSELGFVRFVVSDNYDEEYMIYESYRMFENDSSFNFSQKCEESCFFESYTPSDLIVQVHDAIVTISNINLSNSNYNNAEYLREQAAASSIERKITAVQSYIEDNNLIWRAGHTAYSDLSYASKAKLWGEGFGSYGYEYYASGIYCHARSIVDPHDYYVDFYDYIDNFDWRNRHGANNEDSPYYDNDPNGTGWITPVVCQKGCWFDGTLVCGFNDAYSCEQSGGEFREAPSCWVFGPTANVESMVNLYYNEHVDLDLSEQAILCRLKSPNATTIPRGSSTNALNVYKNYGVPLEECLRYSATYENCSDICDTPTELISITDFNTINNSYPSVRQNLIQNGPLTTSGIPYPWYQGNPPYQQTESHCMLLVGWGTIDKDTPSIIGVPYGFDSRWYGVTYWIYKNSVGPNHEHEGFEYIIHPKAVSPRMVQKIVTPIMSMNRTDSDINCYDRDGDGYYFWGIGSKPSHCPPCPDEPDGDDNNPGLGPVNPNGQCTIINSYTASFEHGWDNWIIPSCSNFDWNRKNDPCNYVVDDPNQQYHFEFHLQGAQDGDFYLYADGSSAVPDYENCILESAPIDFENYCGGVLDFYLYQNSYIWGNPGDVKTEVQISYDFGQTWINDYWYIEDSQGEGWHHEVITFPSSVNKIRIVGHPQRNYIWVLALDNITIKPMTYNNSPMVINTNEEWNDINYSDKDIVIENNGVLTIKSSLSIHPEAKIIVKPGGRLILDSCLLTSSCPNELWQGIEVWGDRNTHQYEINGSYGQGYVEMKNGATIENAVCALNLWRPGYMSTTGGIIHATDAIFRNNKRSVYALYYKNQNYISGRETDYNAWFKRCQFIVNGNYHGDSNQVFCEHVYLDHVKGFKFRACDFSGAMPSSNIRFETSGIAGREAGFSVEGLCSNNNIYPCPSFDESSFNGFFTGINAVNDGSKTPPTISITHTSFTNNDYGIYGCNLSNATILYCDFDVKRQDSNLCGAGIFIDYMYGFAIEENELKKTNSFNGDSYGIIVKNSACQNQIYRNTFTGLHCGNLADGRNYSMKTSNDYLGLEYRCNTNLGNDIDFYVLKQDGIISGIQSSQGNNLDAARNTFSTNGYHFFNGGDYKINYYYYDMTGFEDEEPLYYNSGQLIPIPTTETEGCTTHHGNTPVDVSSFVLTPEEKQQREQEYYEAYNTYHSLKAVYEQHVDGGSTQNTLNDIAMATPSDMWALRAQLLGISPYVSEEVLTRAIDRKDIFTESVLFEILLSNPDELRKNSLMNHLREQENLLSQDMIDILDQVANGISGKTLLQNRMAANRRAFSRAAGDIIRSIMNDAELDLNELRLWLSRLEHINADYDIIATYMDEGDFASALALANMLPSLYELTGEDLVEHQAYTDLLLLFRKWHNDGRNAMQMDSTERAMVEHIADYGTGHSQNMAQAILLEVGEERYVENTFDCPSLTLPQGGHGRGYTFTQEDISKALGMNISVKPNPATTWTAVDYTLPARLSKATITITNTLGVTVMSTELNGNQGQKVLDLRGMADGVYVYTISCGEYVQTGKLIITK